jgi:hypothetical protein
MRRPKGTNAVSGWRSCLIAVSLLAPCTPVGAHHQLPHEGATIGVAIPAITHGEMLVVGKYRDRILDLAARQPRTDPTLRRLAGFVSLQHFACFWGLVPGSLSDETSPFNECSHADLAGARALLAHMVGMPGDQSAARALEARIDTEIASDPAFSVLCSNSNQAFDSGIIIGPDWQLAPAHLPTVLTFVASVALAAAGLWGISRFISATGRSRKEARILRRSV